MFATNLPSSSTPFSWLVMFGFPVMRPSHSMNCSRCLGLISALVSLSQVTVPKCPCSSVSRSLSHQGQNSRVCSLVLAWLLHEPLVACRMGDVSTTFSWQRRRPMALGMCFG